MTPECEFKLNSLCFNPEKVCRGLIALPCTECNCQECSKNTEITINNLENLKNTNLAISEDYHYDHSEIQQEILHINMKQPKIAEE